MPWGFDGHPFDRDDALKHLDALDVGRVAGVVQSEARRLAVQDNDVQRNPPVALTMSCDSKALVRTRKFRALAGQ